MVKIEELLNYKSKYEKEKIFIALSSKSSVLVLKTEWAHCQELFQAVKDRLWHLLWRQWLHLIYFFLTSTRQLLIPNQATSLWSLQGVLSKKEKLQL